MTVISDLCIGRDAGPRKAVRPEQDRNRHSQQQSNRDCEQHQPPSKVRARMRCARWRSWVFHNTNRAVCLSNRRRWIGRQDSWLGGRKLDTDWRDEPIATARHRLNKVGSIC